MNICRLCLHKGDGTQVPSIWDSQIEDLPNKIWSCVSIKIRRSDDLPTTACLSCINKVTQWITFKQNCENSNSILSNNFKRNKCDSSLESANDVNKLSCDKYKRTDEPINWEDNFDTKHGVEHEEDEQFFKGNYSEIQYELGISYTDYECDICKRKFELCSDYLDHQSEHDGSSVFQCDKCPKVFDSREKIVEHDRKHKRPCPHCGKMILKSSMKLHLIQHTDRHRCIHCLNRFNSKASLAQHIITVHTDIKNHICCTCGKKFSSKTALKVHMKSHSNERLYKCKLCSYAGRTASALYVHMSTHSDYMCICEVCSKTFKSTRNLNDHLRRVHNESKKHECNYCGKRFVDKYMLSIHIRCHTGVRPYKCTLCEKAFIRSDGLKEHLATHGDRILYECQKCGKKFTSKKGIARHTCKL
ncbi:hypothetical protein Trydic_g6224 [Trypoxylus dichotomus]